MKYSEEYFENLMGKVVEVVFHGGKSIAGTLDCYLPEKDNGYNAILLKSGTLTEIKLDDIKEVVVK